MKMLRGRGFCKYFCIFGVSCSRVNKEARALFSRALAELKYMGMVKNSRKKADHLAKLSWKGL